MIFFIHLQPQNYHAKVAQLVEHDLAKVGVAGPNPVFRSKPMLLNVEAHCGAPLHLNCGAPLYLIIRPGGGTGRHAGLKILWLRGRAGSSPARGTIKPL